MDVSFRGKDKLAVLDQIPLFAELAAKDKETIAVAISIVEFRKGEHIYKELDPPDAFYCIISGRLRVYIRRQDKDEDLEYLKRGKYFGIISLLTNEPHSVAVQAVNDSIILKISKDDFAAILKRVPRLAIHFGQTLSRRLKRKDLLGKKIFESAIVSIYGLSDKIGTSYYVYNLAVSLKREADKDVIVLSLLKKGKQTPDMLGIGAAAKPFALGHPIVDSIAVKESTVRHPLGIDLISIPYGNKGHTGLTSLLSYLTSDYHYILVDMPGEMDGTIFETLKQSDEAHLVTLCDEAGLHSAADLIAQLKRSASGLATKIRIITSEHGSENRVPYLKRRAMLAHEVFATLPDLGQLQAVPLSGLEPVVIANPSCEYSRMIRRISRQLGDCLIGLALGAGAAMGLAHIGVLKVLEREHIPIDVVSGTSIGSLIGAFWAAGKSPDEIVDAISIYKNKLSSIRLLDLTFPRRGLIKGREVRRFIDSHLKDMMFTDLKVPFKVITCDIETREEVVIEEGLLAEAVMASIAIPGVFEPVNVGGRLLVDGGIINPLPTNSLIKAGVSKIVAVNTLPSPEDIKQSRKKTINIFDMIVNSVQASEYLLAESSCQNADVVLHPVLAGVGWYELYEYKRLVEKGEKDAMEFLPRLKELAASR